MSLGVVRRAPLQIRYRTSWSGVIGFNWERKSVPISEHRCHGTATTSESLKTEAIKPFSEVPVVNVPLMTLLRSLFSPELAKKMQKNQLTDIVESFRKFGSIYRFKMATFDMVQINDVKAMEQIMRQDGQYPKRMPITPWVAYREMKGLSPGILTAEGEEWIRMRKTVDKPLLQIKYMDAYTDSINEVVEDFVQRLAAARGEDLMVPQLDQEFFNFALESVGTLLYERRLGLLGDSQDENMRKFTQSVGKMFELTLGFIAFPMWLGKFIYPSKWKQFVECWDIFFKIGKQCVEESDPSKSNSILSQFLSQKNLTEGEIIANVTELMAAAVDTTSNALLWILYEVARHQEVQEKIAQEINDVVPKGIQPTYKHLKDMPYVKAVIKETLRFHAPVTGNTRVLQNDVNVLGYTIPAKTTVIFTNFVMCQSADNFENPSEYKPERWLRENKLQGDVLSTYAFLPFGIGTRMCVGRRIAELEMYLVVSQLCQRFKIELSDDIPLGYNMRMLYVPERQVPVRFTDRNG